MKFNHTPPTSGTRFGILKNLRNALVASGLACLLMCLSAGRAGAQTQAQGTNNSPTSDAAIDALLEANRKAMQAADSGAPHQAAKKAVAPVPTPPTNSPKTEAAHSPTSTPMPEPVATNEAPGALDNKHKLEIGDRLSFRIVEDGDASRPIIVTDSGDVEVPYIGRVPAEKKTCRELAAEIKAALEKEYYYQATVILAVDVMALAKASTTRSLGRVYIVGAVRSPGPVELPTDETLTLSRAILRAGGFADYADKKHVKLTRHISNTDASTNSVAGMDDARSDKGSPTTTTPTASGKKAGSENGDGKEDKKTFIINVADIFDGKIETDLNLEPGDLITVPDRLIRFN